MGHLASPRGILRMIFRRLPLILLIIAIGWPASIWFALSRPKLYEATAVIQIETAQVAEQLAGQAMQVGADNQLELIKQKLMSRDNLIAMIDEFGLFAGDMPITEKVFLLREAATIFELVDQSQGWRPDLTPSGLVILVRLDDAEKAAAVANSFLDSIVEEARARSEGRAARTLEFFVAEEARVSTEIGQVEAVIADFKQVNVASLPEGLAAQRERLTRMVEQQIEIDQALIALETSSERLREDERERQRTLLAQQRALIAGNIAEIEAALAAAPEIERRLSALDRQLEQLNTEYAVITQRRTEAAMNQLLEEQDQAERFEVLETAIVPEFPITASRRKIAAAGGAATVMLALAAALLAELAGGKIRTAAQLEAQLGVRPVIVVPNLTTRGQRLRRRLAFLAILAAILGGLWTLLRMFGSELATRLPFLRSAEPLRLPVSNSGG